MNFNKLLSFQSLLFFPILIFVLIYTNHNIVYFLAIAGLSIYAYFTKLKINSLFLLFTLIGSYYIYAFQNLGSKNTPQSYEVYNTKGSQTFIDLEKTSTLDEVCFYFAINKNANFSFSYQKENSWETFYKHEVDAPTSFQWICNDVNVTTQNIKLTLIKGQMMLSELRFREQKKDINFTTTNHSFLNDETNIKVSKSYYDNMVFDEIYHGRTAYELMRDISPIYENTHPYLGKLLILPGIKLFDMTPFGWRFTNVIFAALFIFVAYYFALKLFREPLYAFVASFLMTYSFMHFTVSRLGLIDTFGVLFVFISYYFLFYFIKKQKLSLLLLSGLFFGLASAVKWSAVFSGLGFVLIALYLLISQYPLNKRFAGYKLIAYGLLSYGFLAFIVYGLTFYDIYLKTGSLQSIIDYQVNMFAYHSNLIAEHPYSSSWWSWPFDVKPMCAYRNIENNSFSSISIFGNPAIFWTGIIAMLYLVYIFMKRRTLEGTFILFAFMSLYLPYIFVGRLMFMYHYYYAVPFLILAIVYGIKDFLNYYPKYSILLWIYLAIVAGLFLEFYPVLSGYEVPKSYVDNFLTWFPSWWL